MIHNQLDLYDDPQGLVLKRKIASYGDVPEFIKEAEHLDESSREALPDDVYALVMLDQGHKMRKYACVDPGNTALSVMYFMENRHKLPEEAQKTAAENLVTACKWHSLAVPQDLEKVAIIGPAMLALNVAGGHSTYKKRQQALKAGMPGSQVMKVSDLTGSYPMPIGKEPEKKASLEPYVDITGQRPPQPVETIKGEHHCLIKEGSAKYPIDTAVQVQQAQRYFLDHKTDFEPFERRQYCVKLAARADQMGLRLEHEIVKYASDTTSPDAPLAIYTRQRMFHQGSPEHGMLEELRQKCASIKPEVLAMTLENIDRHHDLDQLWDQELPDPYASVYGPIKTAEWSYVDGNDYINETRLKRCAKDGLGDIESRFGKDLAEEFRSNPRQIFDSLPLDSKRIIMRIASQLEE